MERVTKALVVLAIFLMTFFASAEGGRDVPTKKEVDNPQSWNGGDGGGSWGDRGGHRGGWGGPWGGNGGGWGGHGWFPWFPHFPWGWGGIHEAEDALKYVPKGEKWVGEVPKVDGKAGNGYP